MQLKPDVRRDSLDEENVLDYGDDGDGGLHNRTSDCAAADRIAMAAGWVTDLGRSLLSFLVGGSGGGNGNNSAGYNHDILNLTAFNLNYYRGTIPNGKNLPLTQFLHLRQLMGRSCSYLLPRQNGGISQNYVNGRFLPFGMVPLYI